ncbi:hypothetical protein V2I01_12155 [Micromonospora sp. BRA006-A]|nr:hypothetical protein [Micromonospora sp. BRA006-A]
MSGKGLLLIRDAARLDQIHRTLPPGRPFRRSAAGAAGGGVGRQDSRSQLPVHRVPRRRVHFDFVKEAVTANGAQGSPDAGRPDRTAARRSDAQRRGARRPAGPRRLPRRGRGGRDARPEGGVYPVVEINARHNMSTYQVGLQEHLVPAGWYALARQYPLRLARPLRFGEVRDGLGPWLLSAAGGAGMVVQNFSTVNALVREGAGAADGRLYGLLTARTADELTAMDAEIAGRLAAVAEGTRR